MPWDRFIQEQLAGDEMVQPPYEKLPTADLYKLIATVPGDEAVRPLDKGGCPLVKTN